MSPRARIQLSLAVVLFSGMVIGFFGGQMYLHWRVTVMMRQGPTALREFMLGRLRARLRLQPDQVPAVEIALARVAQNLEEHRRRQEAQQWDQMRQALSEMQPALTVGQQETLDQMSLEDLLPGPRRKPAP
jgi:hypothetical protein